MKTKISSNTHTLLVSKNVKTSFHISEWYSKKMIPVPTLVKTFQFEVESVGDKTWAPLHLLFYFPLLWWRGNFVQSSVWKGSSSLSVNNSYSYQNITHAMLSSPPPLSSTSFTSTTGQMVSVGQANEWDNARLSMNRSYSYPQISMQGHTSRAS